MKAILTALSVCALLAVAGFQYRQIAGLRAENAVLAAAAAEADQIRKDLAGTNGAGDPQPEIDRLRAQNLELLHLRSEVGQLRNKAQQIPGSTGRAGDAASTPVALAGPMSFSKEQLSNAGFQTPEAALQTFFWSYCHGDMESVANCFVPELQSKMEQLREEMGSEHQMANEGARFRLMEIVASRQVAVDRVEFVVQVERNGGSPIPPKAKMVARRIGNEWKLELPQE
jgi:hypothetical protein